ncbi:MAG TPA: cell division topological specificity factor MinE [Candidatus Rubrimentiphilum sp.]|nr:cell division topological specificity factor MinE [Candidatus Rubrimentiphilum sp.]
MTLNEILTKLNQFFGRENSGATAKERLRLVLMSDHLSLAPDMVDRMKRDLVEVVSRYVEVDRDKIDVRFEHQDRVFAMLANVPILSVNRTPPSPPRPRRRRRRKSSDIAPPVTANMSPTQASTSSGIQPAGAG